MRQTSCTAAEELLVQVTFALPDEVKGEFEKRLSDAMVADSFTDVSNLWNDERRRVVVEALDQHLLPAGSKYAREWLREEIEDHMAWRCASTLREVRGFFVFVDIIPLN